MLYICGYCNSTFVNNSLFEFKTGEELSEIAMDDFDDNDDSHDDDDSQR